MFKIKVSELSSFLTPIAFNPNRDVVEDRRRLVKFNQKQVEAIAAQFLLAYYSIMDLQNIERRIFFYYYPRFSEFMKYFMILFVLIFDGSHLLSYIIAFLIIILVLYNEEWYQKLYPLFHSLFLCDVNPYINDQRASMIKTVKQDTMEKNTEILRNFAVGKKRVEKDDSGDEEDGKEEDQYTRKKRGLFGSL